MQKPLSASSLFEHSSLLSSLEKKVESLQSSQESDKKSLQALLGNCVKIESMNFETKELYWSKRDQQPTRKLIRLIKTSLIRHLGAIGCQWQCKLSGE